MNLAGNQLGWRGYADIVRALQIKPMHAVDLMARVKMTRCTARRILTRLHELDVVHIGGWEKVPPSRTFMPVYHYGEGADMPCPGGKPGGFTRQAWRQHNRLTELSHFVSIIKAMREPISLPALVAVTGSAHSNLRLLVKYMRKINLCRIGDWEAEARVTIALYVMGQGPDKKKPPRMDRIEVNKRYRDGLKAKQQTLRIIRALAANSEMAEAA